MSESTTDTGRSACKIEEQSFASRFLFPVGIALCTWLVFQILSRNLGWIENPGVYRTLMNALHVLIYVSYAMSSLLFVYPTMFFRGASLTERVVGSYITPLAFVGKEVMRVSEFFTPGEALYYAFSGVLLGNLLLQFGFMGLAEMICRTRCRKKYGFPVKVITWGPPLAIAFSLFVLYITLIWGMGVHWFYIYQEGYKLLFQ